jgi:hypothetical protein
MMDEYYRGMWSNWALAGITKDKGNKRKMKLLSQKESIRDPDDWAEIASQNVRSSLIVIL